MRLSERCRRVWRRSKRWRSETEGVPIIKAVGLAMQLTNRRSYDCATLRPSVSQTIFVSLIKQRLVRMPRANLCQGGTTATVSLCNSANATHCNGALENAHVISPGASAKWRSTTTEPLKLCANRSTTRSQLLSLRTATAPATSHFNHVVLPVQC